MDGAGWCVSEPMTHVGRGEHRERSLKDRLGRMQMNKTKSNTLA